MIRDRLTALLAQQAPSTDCYEAGNGMFQCALGDIVAPFGDAVFGLIAGGAILLGLYYAGDGSLATPTVVLILLGGILIPMLAAGYGGLAMTLTVIGIAAGFWGLFRRYILTPGT